MAVTRVEERPVGRHVGDRSEGDATVELNALAPAGAAIARVAGEWVERLLIAHVHPEQRRRRAQRRAIHDAVEFEAGLIVPNDDRLEHRIADDAVGPAESS